MFNRIRNYFSQLLNPESLTDCTIVFTSFLRYFGSNPYKFDYSSDNLSVSISPVFALYGLFIILCYIYCVVSVTISGETTTSFLNTSYIFNVASTIRIIQGFISITFLGIESSLAIHRYSKTHSSYNTVDKLLRHRLRKTYKNILYASFILIAQIPISTGVLCCLVYYTLSIWSTTPSFEIMIAENYPDLLSFLSLAAYGLYVYVFREYIRNINDELKELLKDIQNKDRSTKSFWLEINDPNYEIRNKYLKTRIRKIWVSYDACCDIPESVNSSYSYKFVSMLIAAIFTVVLNFFYLVSIVSLINSGDDSEILKAFFIISAVLCITKLIFIMAPIVICEQCKTAGNETADLISKLLICHVDNDVVSKELQRFSTYIMNRKINISLLYMFDMDNKLIFGIIGAICTYTIVFIQFSLAPELKT